MFIEPCDKSTCDKIDTIVSDLKNNAFGSDEISAAYLKMSLASITNLLVYICNMPLSEVVFLTQLKWPMYLYINVTTP